MIPNYTFFKELYGLITLLDVFLLAPFLFRYIGTAYNSNSIVKTKFQAYLIAFGLVASGLAIMLNYYAIIGALFLLIIFRYVHIDQRYKSLARGAGAVGYMPYHCAFMIFSVEFITSFEDTDAFVDLYYLFYIIEISVIFLCAGISKGLAGYTKGNGFEIALANPIWSNFYKLFKSFKPSSLFFKIQNYFGFATEIVCGTLLLFPATRVYGAILIALIFLWILITLNLALLPVLMICLAVLFLPELELSIFSSETIKLKLGTRHELIYLMLSLFALYIILTIITKLYLYFRTFGKGFWKINKNIKFFETLGTMVPIFIWRVFTADVTNIFVRVTKDNGEVIWNEKTKSFIPVAHFIRNYRFFHVAEMVVLSTIFNQLKYHDNGVEVVKSKLLQYVPTLKSRVSPNEKVIFELVRVEIVNNHFQHIPYLEFITNSKGETLEINNKIENPLQKLALVTS